MLDAIRTQREGIAKRGATLSASAAQFPVTSKWAFLDHAAVAPLSGPALQALCEWATDMAENGDVFLERWIKRVEQVRASAARLIGSICEIAFIKEHQRGNLFRRRGISWKPSDNVVTAPKNTLPICIRG